MGRPWYATPDWNEDVGEAFEARLRRARPYNRPQYLRIKAVNLLDAPNAENEAVARELLSRILDEYPESFDVHLAHEILGELFAKAGDLSQAESHFRACLDVESGTSGVVDLKLAEALFELGSDERLDEVAELLAGVGQRIERGRVLWPSQIFRAVLLSARLAARRGESEIAASEAASALRIADMANERPVLPRHPDLGKVVIDADLRRELNALSQGKVPSAKQRAGRRWFRRGGSA